jgi:hypothetical protein
MKMPCVIEGEVICGIRASGTLSFSWIQGQAVSRCVKRPSIVELCGQIMLDVHIARKLDAGKHVEQSVKCQVNGKTR